jgi:hypothetical protein
MRDVDENGKIKHGKYVGLTLVEAQISRRAEIEANKKSFTTISAELKERTEKGIEENLKNYVFDTTEGLEKLERELCAEGLFKLRDEPASGNTFLTGAGRFLEIIWGKIDRKNVDIVAQVALLQKKMIELGDKLRDAQTLHKMAEEKAARYKKLLNDNGIVHE